MDKEKNKSKTYAMVSCKCVNLVFQVLFQVANDEICDGFGQGPNLKCSISVSAPLPMKNAVAIDGSERAENRLFKQKKP